MLHGTAATHRRRPPQLSQLLSHHNRGKNFLWAGHAIVNDAIDVRLVSVPSAQYRKPSLVTRLGLHRGAFVAAVPFVHALTYHSLQSSHSRPIERVFELLPALDTVTSACDACGLEEPDLRDAAVLSMVISLLACRSSLVCGKDPQLMWLRHLLAPAGWVDLSVNDGESAAFTVVANAAPVTPLLASAAREALGFSRRLRQSIECCHKRLLEQGDAALPPLPVWQAAFFLSVRCGTRFKNPYTELAAACSSLASRDKSAVASEAQQPPDLTLMPVLDALTSEFLEDGDVRSSSAAGCCVRLDVARCADVSRFLKQIPLHGGQSLLKRCLRGAAPNDPCAVFTCDSEVPPGTRLCLAGSEIREDSLDSVYSSNGGGSGRALRALRAGLV